MIVYDLKHSISDETEEMLFSYRYRSHYHLSEKQFEEESEESIWLTRTIWELEAERDNLKSRSGTQ